ncbi:MAG: helix-turn-helix domain-containing protein [Anaeromyxobacter sp.]
MMLAAERAGMSGAEFARRTGVTPAEAEDPAGRTGRSRYERVLGVMDLLQPPAVPPGDETGLSWSEVHFPALVAAWLNAPTLRAAIDTFIAYRPILGEFDVVTAREAGATLRVEYAAEGPQRYAPWQAAGNLCVVAHVVRAYEQGTPARLSAGLVGPPPPRALRAGRERLLSGPVAYEQQTNFLDIPRQLLDVPFSGHNQALQGLVLGQLARELRDLARAPSFAAKAERALQRSVAAPAAGGGPEAVLEALCNELGVSRWTLGRRLAGEGVCFKDLLTAVRVAEAKRLLDGSGLSLAEVSDRLGFASQSSFTRFFRAEAGVAPGSYRAGRLAPGRRGQR